MLQAFPEEVVSCRLLLTSIGEHQQMLGVVHHLLAFHERGERASAQPPHGAPREEPAEDRRLPRGAS